jgi:hypothetical protein
MECSKYLQLLDLLGEQGARSNTPPRPQCPRNRDQHLHEEERSLPRLTQFTESKVKFAKQATPITQWAWMAFGIVTLSCRNLTISALPPAMSHTEPRRS